jgi:hypothetical protein
MPYLNVPLCRGNIVPVTHGISVPVSRGSIVPVTYGISVPVSRGICGFMHELKYNVETR